MPARTLSTPTGQYPDAVRLALTRIAGLIDDPIAKVRVNVGDSTGESEAEPGEPFERLVKLQVVDRLDQVYEPESFIDTAGRNRGRWIITLYVANTEFGTPIDAAPVMVTGELLGKLEDGFVYFMLTDSAGLAEFNLTALPEDAVWFHTGVPTLLRSRGVSSWGTGTINPPPPPDDGDGGGGSED